VEFAKRSATVAISFGLAAALSVVVLGDESGYTLTEHQRMKIAAIEGMWHTEPAPAPFTIVGIPDADAHQTHAQIQVPWMLGLIATRSLDTEVPGIVELVDLAKQRIINGIPAYTALRALRQNPSDEAARQTLKEHAKDLGYALLLRKYVEDPAQATPAQIDQAAWNTVPSVGPMFWTFRVMVGLGFFFIALFGIGFVLATRRRLAQSRRFLTVALWTLPLPWCAAELGWFVAEHGRQPWAIEGVLPTFLAVSPIPASSVALSLTGFVVFYTVLAVIDVFLLKKYVKLGPGSESPPRAGRADPGPALETTGSRH
jgi:cytochrome d ubiquinol oxidase subunit I